MNAPEMPPDPRFYYILKKYAQGQISAMTAADEIQELRLPGYEDPSASEVILWSKIAGFGIPAPTREEAEKEARKLLEKRKSQGK